MALFFFFIIMMMMMMMNVCWPPEAEEPAYLHLDLGAVDLLSDGLDDADHDVLQAFSLRVVVKDQAVALLCVRAAEGWRPHPGVDGAQVVVQSIQILKSPINPPPTSQQRPSYPPVLSEMTDFKIPFFTCKNSRTFDPRTRRMVSYPDSWQNSKNIFPNSCRMSPASISARGNSNIKKPRQPRWPP